MLKAFDNVKYINMQAEHIKERIEQWGDKLYLEFGGKIFDDYHAKRVLPGYDPNCKIKLLLKMKDMAEIILCVSAKAIEKNKIRNDLGITYDMEVLRLIENISAIGLKINSVVVTLFADQPAAVSFKKKLESRGVKTYTHSFTKGYPTDVETIVSEEGYGANSYIETTMPLVVVTAPGPGSGKMATCLSQLYHEHKRGKKAGFAKFETFPIWNLPLKHPVNLAYEAATADLHDVNMIDPYHLEAYGSTAVNYNRDIEVFPVVKTILSRITENKDVYASPTDMGVNMVGYCICDDEAAREAAKQEVIRRYFKSCCEVRLGLTEEDIPGRIEVIMQQLSIKPEDRKVVLPARQKDREGTVMALELPDGMIVTGSTTKTMTAAAGAVINAIKYMAGLAEDIHLLSPVVLEPIIGVKREVLGMKDTALNLEEALIAVSICAATNTVVATAMKKLKKLNGCEAHATTLLSANDEDMLRKLKINLTCEAIFPIREQVTETILED